MPEKPLRAELHQAAPPVCWVQRASLPVAVLAAGCFLAVFIGGCCYLRFAGEVDRELAQGSLFENVRVYGAPAEIAVGDRFTAEGLISRLRRGAYSSSPANPAGWYRVAGNSVQVFSPHREPASIEFQNGRVSRIVSLTTQQERERLEIGGPLLAGFSRRREQYWFAPYAQIPPSLVHAVLSVEDKHFFDHSGVDFFRILKAAYVDLKEGRKQQGASTLTMQLARGLWLQPDKRWKRKVKELLLALRLEEKLSKQEIFEAYANQVYLGSRDNFSIRGFGAASRLYFHKDVSELSDVESALLAGMIQRPAYFNPMRYPRRAIERRNRVLRLMRENGYLTEAQYKRAAAQPLAINPGEIGDSSAAPFFRFLQDELQSQLGSPPRRLDAIETTLDADLQEAARDAIRRGMESIDRLEAQRRTEKRPADKPEAALIALDPHTGAIRALVAGRGDGISQLNHVLTLRQPGSVFKPFVFAAALENGMQSQGQIFSPSSILHDAPASIPFANERYQPENFHHEYKGPVTLRTALAESLNSATVQLAAQVGYDRVLEMARMAGLDGTMQPTPALALGAYETSPLAVAEAYTIFANGGVRVRPTAIERVRAAGGSVFYPASPEGQPVLDPRVAYLMENMMQEVLEHGTAASAKALGFRLPAAGKTGTTRDAWFAGFTTRLLGVVWVGFDDNRDLQISAARSALPIWTDFMLRAAALPRYRNPSGFPAPPGIAFARICSQSGQLAGPYCPRVEVAPFLEGAQPKVRCTLHGPSKMRGEAEPAVVRVRPPAPDQKQLVPAEKGLTAPASPANEAATAAQEVFESTSDRKPLVPAEAPAVPGDLQTPTEPQPSLPRIGAPDSSGEPPSAKPE
jgi:penicillin-binding protein 1B